MQFENDSAEIPESLIEVIIHEAEEKSWADGLLLKLPYDSREKFDPQTG
jgi:hypothetical protein